MIYGDLQFFDIIVFAAIAIFLIYRLRSVLGKRTGFQKTQTTQEAKKETHTNDQNPTPQLKESEQKLSVVYLKNKNFDHKQFLEGAKKAFELIITSYNEGNKKTLKELVSKEVFYAFEKSIDEKTNDPNSQFYSLVVDGVENATVENNTMKITLKFTSEQFKDNDEGSITKKQDTWTFEKKIDSKNPAWILTST